MTTVDSADHRYAELMREVTEYVVGYWEDAADGHPYHAMHHPGHTARDMASAYMTERYEDWLRDVEWTEPDRLARYASLGEGDTPVEAAMDAFDRMFEIIWPHAAGDNPLYP
ncbi:hypothetical protein KIH77_00730 [Bifidobacterium sp. 82T24]|uniref:hypothetical protein n=1 Tax=Bifidobacterium pluvialisilvae TaxID=2834436 RepID=UPI001C569044|nr:hypothetical protein [Bifidobacterium pluvialisilvae]MBW3087270.1 hypothetical protein [Bifidobacterium pluvialisilvae]